MNQKSYRQMGLLGRTSVSSSRSAAWLALGAVVVLIISAGGYRKLRGAGESWLEVEGAVSGIPWRVKFHSRDKNMSVGRVNTLTERRMQRTLLALSLWNPDSEISIWNRNHGPARQEISEDFRSALAMALEVAHTTGGAFDPCHPAGKPGRFHDLHLEARTISSESWCPLDLTAVIEGQFLEGLAGDLDAEGYARFLISWGGEFRACGDGPDGNGWPVGWEAPNPAGKASDLWPLRLHNEAWSVSGNYRSFFQDGNGVIHSNLKDGRDGRKLEGRRFFAAGVRASSALEADAWATACAILGIQGVKALDSKGSWQVQFREINLETKDP